MGRRGEDFFIRHGRYAGSGGPSVFRTPYQGERNETRDEPAYFPESPEPKSEDKRDPDTDKVLRGEIWRWEE